MQQIGDQPRVQEILSQNRSFKNVPGLQPHTLYRPIKFLSASDRVLLYPLSWPKFFHFTVSASQFQALQTGSTCLRIILILKRQVISGISIIMYLYMYILLYTYIYTYIYVLIFNPNTWEQNQVDFCVRSKPPWSTS